MKLTTQSGGSIELADSAFAVDYNETLVHQVVTAFRARARAGTKAQKTRAEVRGGGIKPWRQKGTGRARAGTIRSPIFVGGGRAFAAAPRDYSQKVNRKMYRAAMRSIVSELARQERLLVVDDIALEEPKTRLLLARLQELGADSKSLLILVEAYTPNLCLAARNLHGIEVLDAREINPLSLVRFDKVLATEAVLKKLEERLV